VTGVQTCALPISISVDDNHLAGQILLRKRFRLLCEEDLAPSGHD
jgi:hypothetical protein